MKAPECVGELRLVCQGTARAACSKMRICHPEPASFAGEGSAFCKKAKEKADSSRRLKTEQGSEMTYFKVFPQPVEAVP
jgi:hypothetical protein